MISARKARSIFKTKSRENYIMESIEECIISASQSSRRSISVILPESNVLSDKIENLLKSHGFIVGRVSIISDNVAKPGIKIHW